MFKFCLKSDHRIRLVTANNIHESEWPQTLKSNENRDKIKRKNQIETFHRTFSFVLTLYSFVWIADNDRFQLTMTNRYFVQNRWCLSSTNVFNNNLFATKEILTIFLFVLYCFCAAMISNEWQKCCTQIFLVSQNEYYGSLV